MAFVIIRNDITKVSADAIVNTANPMPICGGGTDKAIYKAAGKKELLAARELIGQIAPGEARATAGFKLDAQYIIHTVGPEWIDGYHQEFEVLRQCYDNSLKIALELGCESIAFPLISTGTYGFPKDKALQIAVNAFGDFLDENEMQIILVVYDERSFELSEALTGEIEAYIDNNYVEQRRESNRRYRSAPMKAPMKASKKASMGMSMEAPIEPQMYAMRAMPNCAAIDESMSDCEAFEEEIVEVGMSFHDKLFELIMREGLENKDVWKLANLDRKHFSKIQCDANYHPKKKTVMALCIALKLNIEEAKDLLSRADWAFSPSSKVDLIVQKAIIDKQYDIMQLNLTLFKYTNEILGV